MMQRAVATTLVILASAAGAQERGGFVVTLGGDTVQVESFARTGTTLSGTVVTRTPAVRVIRWTMSTAADGRPLRYTAQATSGAGQRVLDAYAGSLVFAGDSVVREAYRGGSAQTTTIAASRGVHPGPGIPYLGVSLLMTEDALRAARQRAGTSADSAIYLLTLIASQTAPQRTRAWFPAPDSAEVSYFGVAKSGYRFDADGRLLRADWTGTTYRYRMTRVASLDVDRIAREWGAAEAAGRSFGALSPRDSSIAMVGAARITVDYSRPSKRGRPIWGTLVPWDTVWRLGADMATHFTTSAELLIGSDTVAAGRYTLWMIPSRTQPRLVVSRAVNVFGTAYNPGMDLASIPLVHETLAAPVERLTILVRDGRLRIEWDDAAWSVPIRILAW